MIIFIKLNNGFGNKIFNLITGLYLQYINGGDLFCCIECSKHEHVDDPFIFDIFYKLKNKYTIVDNMDELRKIELQIEKNKRIVFNCENINSINDFKINEINIDFVYVNKICNSYKYIYEIYNNLPDKDIFSINKKIISQEILKITNNKKYVTIHIRYGDKLSLSLVNKYKNIFLIYSPQFYKDMIDKFKKICKIYIVTDDPIIVKKYILNDKDHDNVKILHVSWWDAFYCLTKSTYNILSISTFTFMATILNKNLKEAYVVLRPQELKLKKIPEEYIMDSTNWIKINNKSYILNYNKKLIMEMIKYKNNYKN